MICDYAQLTFYTPDGERFKTVTNMGQFKWSRKVNDVGAADVYVSLKSFDFDIFTREDLGMVIEVGDNSGSLLPAVDTYWFLWGAVETGGANEEEGLLLRFHDANSLLEDRIVAYRHDTPRTSSPQAYLNEATNQALVRVFRENLGDRAAPGRNLSAVISVGPAVSPAPQIQKDIPWKTVLATMQEICRTSRNKGTPLYFDMVARPGRGGINFEFETYTGQRGQDKRNLGIIRSSDPLFDLDSFEIDYKSSYNVAYVGGSGRGRDRLVEVVTHPRSTRTRFARREVFKSVQSANVNVLRDEGHNLVNNTAGIYSLSGKLLGDLGDRYGFGDRLTIQHRNLVLDCEISAVAGSWDSQQYIDQTVVRSTGF